MKKLFAALAAAAAFALAPTGAGAADYPERPITVVTIVLAVLQAAGLANYFNRSYWPRFTDEPGPRFLLVTVVTLTAGTAVLLVLLRKAQAHGVGNVLALVELADMLKRVPLDAYRDARTQELLTSRGLLHVVVATVGVATAAVVLMRWMNENL